MDGTKGNRKPAIVGAKEALWASAGLVAFLWIGKHLASVTGAGDIIFTAIAAYQLFVPLRLISLAGEMPESHGIHCHGLILGPVAAIRRRLVLARWRRRPRGGRPTRLAQLLGQYATGAKARPRAAARDIALVLVVCLATFPFFAVGHHYWQEFNHHAFRGWRLPPDLLMVWATNTFLIALPEELFYRGFVETRLERWWPTSRYVLWIPLGRTVFVASALFALGHFVGEYNPARLAPFFPAFVFSAMTRRTGSIFAGIGYHGLSNAFSHLIASAYR